MGGDLGEHSMCFFNVHVYSVPIIGHLHYTGPQAVEKVANDVEI